jgi:drug/metabolite transporter (DMT)-like permease
MMRAKDVAALLFLSALWGGSFLCMRIAAPVLGPVVLIELRVLIAGVALLLYATMTKSKLDLRARWRHYLVIGILNSAIPFTLIATAELHLTAGFAAVLNATSPLFGAVVAAAWIKEALTAKKVVGLVLGLLGVAVLVGWSPLPLSATLAFSIAASLAAAACYGFAGVYTKVNVQGVSPLALATCSQLGASLFLLPLTPVVPTKHLPTLSATLAVATLALLCTAVAYLLYFWLIENVGPTKALTVTFLVPVFGVLWGVILLGESLTLSSIIGFGIILTGAGFVTGVFSFRKEKVVKEQSIGYNRPENSVTSPPQWSSQPGTDRSTG